jgi:hypothetical protein
MLELAKKMTRLTCQYMTPDLQAALVCEDVRLEVNSSYTIVGVINAIAVPTIPFRIIKLCVYTRWVSGLGNFHQKVRILSPEEEKEIASNESHFQMNTGEVHSSNITLFGGMEFKEAGDYPVEIILDGDLKSRFLLRILQIPVKTV